jgi:hypothetical protein
MDASRLARALWGGGYAPENDAISYGRQTDRAAARDELVKALSGTWPAQMAKSAVGAAALPGDVYAGRVDPMSQQGIERAADLAGFVTGGSFAASRPAGSLGMGGMPEKPPGVKAFHGSPHDFDKFDLSKIGTGEGAQAYGHGLYFADSEKVAKAYRDANQTMETLLNGKPIKPGTPEFPAVMSIGANGYDKALKQAEEFAAAGFIKQSELDAIRALKGAKIESKPRGKMYEVNIRANPDDFLDWDKPLAEQSESVRKAFLKAQAGGDPLLAELLNTSPEGLMMQGIMPNAKGAAAYKTMAFDDKDPLAASRRLLDAGVPGIKYLDQGSRAAGDGSRNYVVFDDKLIEILRKYGLTGLLGLGAVGGAYQSQTNEGGT